VNAANTQIGSTKELLKMPDAKGLLWVASDGNEDLKPDTVLFLLKRILAKKHPDGRPCFSNIHALAYFSPRMLVELPQSGQPAQFWFSGSRDPGDRPMLSFLSELCNAWPQYVAWAQGIPVRPVGGTAVQPENLRFLGVSPRMPKIKVADPNRTETDQKT